jgi:transcriptional regulator with PAS, ATPase and Fis domain
VRLHREGFETRLTDLGSRNGTLVNGRPTRTALLGFGDVLRLGGCVALVTDRPGPALEIAPGLLAGPLLRAELEGVMRAAQSDLPVILEGETGTGKEVVARAIHLASQRTGPFMAVNCAALSEALAEGELFGYRRGAFTGAERASPGLFRSAQGGTLLLDEVADLPLGIQAKLLRVLEQREVLPLGEAKPVAIDARIIVATQEPLRDVVQRHEFRADLLARLDGVSVRLPPLRERPGDVPALFARVFAAESSGRAPALEADFVERLCLHDWPFNVREVVLLARRLRVLRGDQLSLAARDLPPGMASAAEPVASAVVAEESATDLLPVLISALRASRGNVAQAAAVLGISRQRAYRLMQQQAVDLEELRQGDSARESS